ncbi:hypothetical protein Q1695_004460 [Nippostrongylus brasiliensis]|nr:hypothetical protein Q1695_004460 [Nippostrongylus brasiliensis]
MICIGRRLLPITQGYCNFIIRHCSAAANVVQEMKEILRIATVGDLDDAVRRHEVFRETNDVPDWGVVKLSSILLSAGREQQSEHLLRQHYEETGGEHRYARKSTVQEEQIKAALVRVMNGEGENRMKNARLLYQWLLQGRFCSNKDVFIELFIEKVLERSSLYPIVTRMKPGSV